MTNNKLGKYGERLARKQLRKHYWNVRKLKPGAPFDYSGIDKLTATRTAIEVKTIKRDTGKLVHVETCAMERKLKFMNETNRQGVIMVIIVNGTTQFYLTALKQHISKGMLIEIK